MKTKYYCSCRDKNNIIFKETKVDSDEVCLNCGYYAITNIDTPNYEGDLKVLTKDVIKYKLKQYNGDIDVVARIYNTEPNYIEKILNK